MGPHPVSPDPKAARRNLAASQHVFAKAYEAQEVCQLLANVPPTLKCWLLNIAAGAFPRPFISCSLFAQAQTLQPRVSGPSSGNHDPKQKVQMPPHWNPF